jgi:hypothetical protein
MSVSRPVNLHDACAGDQTEGDVGGMQAGEPGSARTAGGPSPGPSPFVPHGEGRIRARGGWITLRPGAPPPARLGSPPPPKLLGEVGGADGSALCDLHRTAPDGGPLPVRSSQKGENSSARRMDHAASAGAPSGSLRLATSPKTAGGGWGADGSALCDLHRTAPDGGPSPGPSPLVPHGEGRIRSRSGWITLRPRAPPPARLGSPPPPKLLGEVGVRMGRGSATGLALRRARPPGPSPSSRGERENSIGLRRACRARHPSPRCLRGRAGWGAAGGRSEMLTPGARRSRWGGRAAPRLRERRCRRRLSG